MCRHKHSYTLTHTEPRKVVQFPVLRALRSAMHDRIRDHLAQKAREENDCTGSLEARNEYLLGDWVKRMERHLLDRDREQSGLFETVGDVNLPYTVGPELELE